MSTDKTISELNDLLQITNDRLEGFQKVEKKVIDGYPQLKDDYEHMVQQSVEMRSDLSALVRKNGGTPDDTTTVAGGLHRTWIDVKNSLTGDRDESTLENVVFGEKAAIEAYESALKSGNLSPEGTSLVQDQLQKIKSSFQRFENLEERTD